MNKQQGFTFIELMLVAGIIGILIAIAIPAYIDYQLRAKVVDAYSLSTTARHKVADFYRYTGAFPVNNRAAGLPPPDKVSSKYIQRLTIDHGAIHVLFSDADKKLSGKYLTLRPTVVIDSPTTPIHFSCGYATADETQAIIGENKTNLDKKWLAASCR